MSEYQRNHLVTLLAIKIMANDQCVIIVNPYGNEWFGEAN